MPAVPITVPGVGESIAEGILARWLKPDGSTVKSGEPLFELETDKASNVVPAPASGVLAIDVNEGETVQIGAAVGSVDPNGNAAAVRRRSTVGTPVQRRRTATAAHAPRLPTWRSRRPCAGSSPRKRSTSRAVEGTGRGGRVTKGDVLAHLARLAASAGSGPGSGTRGAGPCAAPAPSSTPGRDRARTVSA